MVLATREGVAISIGACRHCGHAMGSGTLSPGTRTGGLGGIDWAVSEAEERRAEEDTNLDPLLHTAATEHMATTVQCERLLRVSTHGGSASGRPTHLDKDTSTHAALELVEQRLGHGIYLRRRLLIVWGVSSVLGATAYRSGALGCYQRRSMASWTSRPRHHCRCWSGGPSEGVETRFEGCSPPCPAPCRRGCEWCVAWRTARPRIEFSTGWRQWPAVGKTLRGGRGESLQKKRCRRGGIK